ncbi:MAG: shikimate kinase [Snowella sp.]|nr:shikimate kinase [Snowella sp.]
MLDALQGLNIYLIGMMGTGKTTIGKILAQKLSYRFFDTDVLVERVVEKSINDLFAEEGEAYFRDLESQVLNHLSAYGRSVIATGGGIVLRPLNWSYLRDGLTIWLDAPVDLLVERLAEDNTRPLLKTDELPHKLTTLLADRKNLYQEADLHILIEAKESPDAIADKILNAIPTVLKNQQEAFQNGNENN